MRIVNTFQLVAVFIIMDEVFSLFVHNINQSCCIYTVVVT